MQDRIDRIIEKLRESSENKNVSAASGSAHGEVKVIAIDGRCASGKTTLARRLAEITGAGVIHMDDFFLPPELRTPKRLAEAGGNVDYERFSAEVLPKLMTGESFTYRRFECSRMTLGESCVIPAGKLRIVEGAYSCHPEFGNYMTFRVFSDVSPDEQRRRILTRSGEEMLSRFLNEWIPMEEQYFQTYRIREKADLIV